MDKNARVHILNKVIEENFSEDEKVKKAYILRYKEVKYNKENGKSKDESDLLIVGGYSKAIQLLSNIKYNFIWQHINENYEILFEVDHSDMLEDDEPNRVYKTIVKLGKVGNKLNDTILCVFIIDEIDLF